MPQDHMLSNTVYDNLKHTVQIGLPAIGTLYFALSQIWGFPYGDEVVGSIVALNTFLGVILGYSTKSYNQSEAKYDGSIDVEDQDDKKLYSLNLKSEPEELEDKHDVLFKVNAPTEGRK